MTIEIDYALSAPWTAPRAPLDLAAADETALRYHAFPGDQILRVDGADFSARWGWVPLLDFAAALVDAVEQLEGGSTEEAVTFTESDARIVLRAGRGDKVLLTCSYAAASAEVARPALAAAARSYPRRLLAELSRRFPELSRNPSLAHWYPTARGEGGEPR